LDGEDFDDAAAETAGDLRIALRPHEKCFQQLPVATEKRT
jgi:hypothetical protein